jgi:DNA-binding transcriptional LysR family regulator
MSSYGSLFVMLDVNRLRILWELRSRGTVAAVAEALNYSSSAVSQQLARLEREVGVQLLQKTGRTLELTAAAETLAQQTGEILGQLEHAEATLRGHDTEITGSLRVGVFQTAVLAIMPQVLRRLRIAHPRLRIEMVQQEPAEGLRETRARGFDLVVAEQYPGHSAPHSPVLDRQPLTQDPIQLALPPDDIDDPAFAVVHSLRDAARLPWVMEPAPANSRHWAEQACRRAGFEPDVRYETADLQAHVRLVESGNAVALLPGLVHQGQSPRVRLCSLDNEPTRTVFTIARVSSAPSPGLSELRRILAEEANRLHDLPGA